MQKKMQENAALVVLSPNFVKHINGYQNFISTTKAVKGLIDKWLITQTHIITT